jgi:hypothetical protein
MHLSQGLMVNRIEDIGEARAEVIRAHQDSKARPPPINRFPATLSVWPPRAVGFILSF